MNIMKGLATYETIKTGFVLFLIVLLLIIAICLTIFNMLQNYLSTTICEIKSIPESNYEQKLTYSVNGQKYDDIINGVTTTVNHVTKTRYAYPEGKCKIYYQKANPKKYNINVNPTTISSIFSGILFVIAFFMTLYFYFLRTNSEFASVMGGVSVANTIIN